MREKATIQLKSQRAILLTTCFVLSLLGLPLAIGGAYLLSLGGSSYYLIAGILLLTSAISAWRGEHLTFWLYASLTSFTIIWAVIEVGFEVWMLLPRIMLLAGLGLWFALPFVQKAFVNKKYLFGKKGETIRRVAPVLLFVLAIALCGGSYIKNAFVPVNSADNYAGRGQVERGNDWPLYGNTARGDRFSPAEEITKDNVGKLELAWRYQTGDNAPSADDKNAVQVTPIQAGDGLYLCTPRNIVIRLNADTGKEQWRFDPETGTTASCRGVSYYYGKTETGTCDDRVFISTMDNRLLALDPVTGKLCSDFGNAGSVDLTERMGDNPRGHQYTTSPPTIIDDTVVLGHSHADGQSDDLPPGVIRGFDARSGQLVWAWDVTGPTPFDLTSDKPYARSTPNVWSIISADIDLGLVFLPMGNASSDIFGGARPSEQELYNSSVVALDAATGAVRWSFKTVHHDIWDLDLPAQLTLVDLDTDEGRKPALVVPTKRGEIFVLDRRTGEPLVPVIEKPVPQNPIEGDWVSATQPYPDGFPSFALPELTEQDMWGVTLLDQMFCRIKFRSHRYDGEFTPPSLEGTITHPPAWGVINWGGVAVDPERQIMIVNSQLLPGVTTLVPHVIAEAAGIMPSYEKQKQGIDEGPAKKHGEGLGAEGAVIFARAGGQYTAVLDMLLSPLGFPCNSPPWGLLSAVDLKTNALMWQQPFGTTRDAAPLGLSLPVGVFNLGSAVVTRSGLAFIGAAIDNYIRAYDVETGREVWRERLPAGGQATPMSYVSTKTGKQYVVIVAGGNPPLQTTPGDYVLAYSLPET